MATKTHVEMIDDLTGEAGEDVTTREIAIDGVTYEVDLSQKNSDELDDVIAVYLENGRKVGRAQRQPTQRKTTSNGSRYNRETSAQQRTWARTHGWPDLKDRGRVPNAVVEAWEQAHPTERAA